MLTIKEIAKYLEVPYQNVLKIVKNNQLYTKKTGSGRRTEYIIAEDMVDKIAERIGRPGPVPKQSSRVGDNNY